MKNRDSEKQNIRRRVLARSRALPPSYCRRADAAISRHILAMAACRTARTVACYVGRGEEIHTLPLLAALLAAGKRLCLPVCTGPGVMDMRSVASLSSLRPGAYGILEPDDTAQAVAPQDIDVLLMPCVTANREGQRLGYGGGFYDRYAPSVPGVRAVLCRQAVLTNGPLPIDAHDITADAVVSEKGAVWTAWGRRRLGLNA